MTRDRRDEATTPAGTNAEDDVDRGTTFDDDAGSGSDDAGVGEGEIGGVGEGEIGGVGEGEIGEVDAGVGGGDDAGDDGFVDTYGKSIAAVLAALVVTHLPLISVVNLVPFVKEAVIGAAVVVAFTSVTEPTDGVKHALVSGMTAAVAFNVVWIPFRFVLGGAAAGAASGDVGAVATGGLIAGFGALLNLVGLVVFSPVGYSVGGAVGSYLN